MLNQNDSAIKLFILRFDIKLAFFAFANNNGAGLGYQRPPKTMAVCMRPSCGWPISILQTFVCEKNSVTIKGTLFVWHENFSNLRKSLVIPQTYFPAIMNLNMLHILCTALFPRFFLNNNVISKFSARMLKQSGKQCKSRSAGFSEAS